MNRLAIILAVGGVGGVGASEPRFDIGIQAAI